MYRTHNKTYSAEYQAWRNMLNRCHNPADPGYPRYGGRGIIVCDEWRNDFSAFYRYVGDRPSDAHSIDRIDNDKGYEPGNVKWSTKQEQQRNFRKNTLVTFNGKTMCISAWADHVGINRKTLSERLRKGWTIAEAMRRELFKHAKEKDKR